MRKFTFVFLCLVAGSTSDASHIGTSLILPLRAIGIATSNASCNHTGGQVETFVKTNHPTLIADIQRGGGATLPQAFDIAHVSAAKVVCG